MVTDSRSQAQGGVSAVPGLGSGKIRSLSLHPLGHCVRAVISILDQAQLPAAGHIVPQITPDKTCADNTGLMHHPVSPVSCTSHPADAVESR